jgi:hypothetical protein
MTEIESCLTRRSLLFITLITALPPLLTRAEAAEKTAITVHKDPNCSCCSGWVRHLQENGFEATVIETEELDAVKMNLGVPDDLAACHTAVLAGYIIEGHIPATALKRLLAEKPHAMGLAVPGMPSGSPGMTGPEEVYEVVLFGLGSRRGYMRFRGDREA